MGLFRKSNDDATRIEELRAEIRLMRQRLDEADAEKARLESRLVARIERTDAVEQGLAARANSIDALSKQVDTQAGDVVTLASQVRRLTEQLTPPPAPAPPPPPPAPPAVDLAAIEEIERRLADLDSVNARLDALSTAVTQQAREALANGSHFDPSQIGDMANRLEDLSVAVATHTTQLAATQERVDAIEPADRHDDTREVVDEMREQLGQMAERMTSLDRRLTNVSTELANQLTELSRDIDTLSERPASTLPPPQVDAGDPIAHLDTDELELRLAEKFDMAIEDVRDSQERLAAEQARYEIKFREDLAELAERLRRPRSG